MPGVRLSFGKRKKSSSNVNLKKHQLTETQFESTFGKSKASGKVVSDQDWMAGQGGQSIGREARQEDEKVVSSKLRADLDEQQLKTFTRWWNSHLVAKGLKVTDLLEDVKVQAAAFPCELVSPRAAHEIPRAPRALAAGHHADPPARGAQHIHVRPL